MLPTTYNINNLVSSSWIAQIPGYESLTLNLSGFDIPEVNAGATAIGNRTEFVYQESGDHIIYENLELTFLLDENMLNYRMLHQWMRDNVRRGQARQESIFIHILNNKKKFQGVEVEFLFAFPIAIGKVELDTDGSSSAVNCTVTFAYTNFDFIETTCTPVIPILE